MRRLRIYLVAVALAMALVPAVSSTAKAAPAGCSSGALCVWKNTNFTGAGPYKFFGWNSSWASYGIENQDSSWWNNGTSGRQARIWTSRGCSGDYMWVPRGVGFNSWPQYSDRGSSNDWPVNGQDPSPSYC